MQGGGRRRSALVLCRVASAKGATDKQTMCRGLQQRLIMAPHFNGMPQCFHSDQVYPEYIIQMAE